MSVKVKTRVEFDVKAVANKIEKAQDRVNSKTAKQGAVMASSIFAGKYRGVEPFKHAEHVMSSFRAQRSIKKDHGWIFGPFGAGKGLTGKAWENSLGGRSFFFEYGRAAPGDARGPKVQPPRSYMRPTKAMLKPRHRTEMEKEFGRTVKQMNKKYRARR